MPFETPPGQLLSSIPPSSDRRRSTKLGGCAGVLFQIFHAKRWLPRKSLPSERLRQASSIHTDDKLPIAKLLLIADENRIGSAKTGDESHEGESADKIEFHEKDGPRRTPGVVARLMGLESMPSPMVVFVESKQAENADDQVCLEELQQYRDSPTAALLLQHPLFQSAKRGEPKTDLPAKFPTSQRKKAQDFSTECEPFSNVPLTSCRRQMDTSLWSPVKSHSLNRNSMSSKKPAHRIEVAPHLLKKNQQNCQSGIQQLQGSFSRAKPTFLHAKGHLRNSAVGASCIKGDGVKTVEAVPCPASNERKHNGDPQRLQSAQQRIRKCSSHEGTLVRGRQPGDKPKALSMEKSRPDLQRQDELNRRLSQPTVCSMKKAQGPRAVRHPSPPKSFHDSSGGVCSSQASNRPGPLCSERIMPSPLTKSVSGSNNVIARKRSGSSIQGSSLKHKHGDEFEDITKPSPVQHTVATLRHEHATLSEHSFYSQFDPDGSTSSAIYTESLQRSSLESSISSDPSLSEFTTASEECSNFSSDVIVAEDEKAEDKQKDDQEMLHVSKRALGFPLMESSTESISNSLTLSSAGETALSHGKSDVNATIVDSVCAFSGKNTAAILQELLRALNSSTAQKKLSPNKKSEATVHGTSGLDRGKPQILPNINVQCNNNLSSESDYQDPALFTPSDGSKLLQENEKQKINNSNKDSAFMNEWQHLEDNCLSAVSGMGRNTVQNGLSRDCEALMTAISKLHQIDPEVIGLKARIIEDHTSQEVPFNFPPPRGAVSGGLPNSDCSGNPAEQTQQVDCSLLSSTTFTAEGDSDSKMYRSDIDSSFRDGYDEVAIWNRKLVTDCIDEAFKSLSKQIYKFSSSLSEPSSATHLLSRVYMQLDEWRGMAASMNLDHMIESEMNVTTTNWRHTDNETEGVAELVNTTIFSGLLEEVLLELM